MLDAYARFMDVYNVWFLLHLDEMTVLGIIGGLWLGVAFARDNRSMGPPLGIGFLAMIASLVGCGVTMVAIAILPILVPIAIAVGGFALVARSPRRAR